MVAGARTGAEIARRAREVARPREIPRELKPWVRYVARVGLAAKAVVYFTLGFLAAEAAVGWGGGTTDTRGAIQVLGRQGGAVAALLIAVGLLCYAAWRVVEAVADTDGDGSDWDGLRKRAAALGSGGAHLGLAATAFGVASGMGAHRSGGVPLWTAMALGAPVGALLVGLAGAIVIAVGAVQFRKAFRKDFFEEEHIRSAVMGPGTARWVRRLGRIGYAARGVTFEIIGFFLVRAALHEDPGEARGIDGAFRFLRGLEYGDVVLAVVATGVAVYGVYMLLLARYRHVGG